MSGHRHDSTAGTQNQGNHIGDRSSVRQSKLYRQHESGNSMKGVLGTSHLSWDTNVQQGAYQGQKVYDHTSDLAARGHSNEYDDRRYAAYRTQYSEPVRGAQGGGGVGSGGVASAMGAPERQNYVSERRQPSYQGEPDGDARSAARRNADVARGGSDGGAAGGRGSVRSSMLDHNSGAGDDSLSNLRDRRQRSSDMGDPRNPGADSGYGSYRAPPRASAEEERNSLRNYDRGPDDVDERDNAARAAKFRGSFDRGSFDSHSGVPPAYGGGGVAVVRGGAHDTKQEYMDKYRRSSFDRNSDGGGGMSAVMGGGGGAGRGGGAIGAVVSRRRGEQAGGPAAEAELGAGPRGSKFVMQDDSEMSNYRSNQRYSNYNHDNAVSNSGYGGDGGGRGGGGGGGGKDVNRNTEVRSTRPW